MLLKCTPSPPLPCSASPLFGLSLDCEVPNSPFITFNGVFCSNCLHLLDVLFISTIASTRPEELPNLLQVHL